MSEKTMVLSVQMNAVPGREQELAEQLRAVVGPTQAEPGCVSYLLHQDPEDPTRFMFYEEFVDQVALDVHVASPHFQRLLAYRAVGIDPVASQSVSRWAHLDSPKT